MWRLEITPSGPETRGPLGIRKWCWEIFGKVMNCTRIDFISFTQSITQSCDLQLSVNSFPVWQFTWFAQCTHFHKKVRDACSSYSNFAENMRKIAQNGGSGLTFNWLSSSLKTLSVSVSKFTFCSRHRAQAARPREVYMGLCNHTRDMLPTRQNGVENFDLAYWKDLSLVMRHARTRTNLDKISYVCDYADFVLVSQVIAW